MRSLAAKLKNPMTKKAKETRVTLATDNEELDFGLVFTDKKTVQNFYNSRARVRRLRGDVWKPKNMLVVDQNCTCKVNLWGFIAKQSYGVF